MTRGEGPPEGLGGPKRAASPLSFARESGEARDMGRIVSASVAAALAFVAGAWLPPAARGQGDLESLPRELERIADAHGLPGFVAYVFEGPKPVFYVASGSRKAGGPDDLRHSDRFHLGSCAKAMTAVIAARLVDREVLNWNLPLRLVDDDVHPDLADVTLAELLLHRAGLVQDLTRTPHWKTLWTAPGSPRQVRQQVAQKLMREAPESPPGRKFAYSNASYLVAGALLERATGTSFEELAQEHVFGPLGMSSCGFGPPAASGPAPLGHRETKSGLEPVPPGPPADNPPALAPAGTAHCSAEDWGRFVMTFLRAYRGESDYISQDSLRNLVASQPDSEAVMGWLKLRRPWSEGFVLHHSGSNTMFYASVWAAPSEDRAVLVFTNRGQAFQAADAMFGRLIPTFFGKP